MRVVLIGAVAFSRHCLIEVLRTEAEVVGVLTLEPELGRRHSDYCDLAPLATECGIPTSYVGSLNPEELVELLRSLAPDAIFVFGWSRLLPREVLEVAPLGCIGTHPTLLPEGRGRHPLVWALAYGLERSGLTFLYLDEGTDTGDVIWQRPFEITLADDAASVYAKIERLASEAIQEFVPQLAAGTAPRRPQDDARATFWRKRTDDDREIDWSAPSLEIYNLVRALTRPYLGATATFEGQRVVVWRAALVEAPLPPEALALAPGMVAARTEERVWVRTGDSLLTLLEVEPLPDALADVTVRVRA